MLGKIRTELGSLDRVKRVVKVSAWSIRPRASVDQPKVVNGFSDLMVEVFGEASESMRVPRSGWRDFPATPRSKSR